MCKTAGASTEIKLALHCLTLRAKQLTTSFFSVLDEEVRPLKYMPLFYSVWWNRKSAYTLLHFKIWWFPWGKVLLQLFELWAELICFSWKTILLKRTTDRQMMVIQTLEFGRHFLTKYKVGLLLQGKQLTVFVANEKSYFSNKIKILENFYPSPWMTVSQ